MSILSDIDDYLSPKGVRRTKRKFSPLWSLETLLFVISAISISLLLYCGLRISIISSELSSREDLDQIQGSYQDGAVIETGFISTRSYLEEEKVDTNLSTIQGIAAEDIPMAVRFSDIPVDDGSATALDDLDAGATLGASLPVGMVTDKPMMNTISLDRTRTTSPDKLAANTTIVPGTESGNDSLKYENLTDVKGNTDIILFNIVPHCGSEALLALFKHVGEMNSFESRELQAGEEPQLLWKQQEEVVMEVYAQQTPVMLYKSFHFFDFAMFQRDSPVYISLIRDPFDRLLDECIETNSTSCTVSSSAGRSMTIPFFCGNNVNCKIVNVWSLNRAKVNVMRYYTAVGVAEKMTKFVEVLDHVIPDFFADASQLYLSPNFGPLTRTQKMEKFHLDENMASIIQQRLKLEYDFYNFVLERFSKLYEDVVG